MKHFWIVLLLLAGSAFGQSIIAPASTVNGVPATNLITICNTNPGSGTCGSLVTTYTTSGLTIACTGTGGPLSGVGCTNPGSSDKAGNIIAFAAAGQYWCQYKASSTSIANSIPCSATGGGSGGTTITTVSGLSSVTGAVKGTLATITDGISPQDCVTGGATGNAAFIVTCQYNGTSWSPVFPGPPLGLPSTLTTETVIGDSISYPTVHAVLQAWPFYLASVGNLQVNDLAQDASSLNTAGPAGNEQITYAYSVSPSTTNLSVALLGANDANTVGANSAFASLQQGYLALAAWLAIPNTNKTLANAGTCDGTYSQIALYGQTDMFSTTVGGTCTFTNINGTTVYVAGRNGSTGNAVQESVTIDSTVVFSGALPAGFASSVPYALRFSGLSSGNHTVLVKAITNGVDASVMWVGGNGAGSGYPVAIGAMIDKSPITGGETTRTTMNANTAAMVAQLQSDGLSVYFVNDANVITLGVVPAEYYTDTVHPNILGHLMLGTFWAFQFYPYTAQNLAKINNYIGNTGNPFTRGVLSVPNDSAPSPITVNANVSTDQALYNWAIPIGLVGYQYPPVSVTLPAILTQYRTLHCFVSGVYTTPAANTSTLEFKAKLCSVSGCASGTVQPLIDIVSGANAGGVTNDHWVLEFWATPGFGDTGTTAQFESHGTLGIDLAAVATNALTVYGDQNTAVTSPSIDTSVAIFMQLTVALSSASASNSVTERHQICELIGN